jgi:hypothetical protein
MSCPVLAVLASAVDAVRDLAVPVGLGADLALQAQISALALAAARLEADLAVRMAALERSGPRGTDVLGEAVRAGLAENQARKLRKLGLFTVDHPAVGAALASGEVRADLAEALRCGSLKLATPQLREELVATVLPLLPPLDAKRAKRLIAAAVDQLQPEDLDAKEQSDHAARRLDWSRTPGGGIVFDGYLPPAEAEAFTGAVNALVESLRTQDDGLSPSQRRADGLAALVSIAAANGLPSGGGLPAVMTLTVSLDEAARVALRDPAKFGTQFERLPHGGSSVGSHPAGDATVRFGVCCAGISPVLVEPPAPGSLLDRIARVGTKPLAVGRTTRLATPAQRQALRLRDDGCAIPGCSVAAAFTEPHHVIGWAVGGRTDLEDMVSLCFVHHRLTELGRFRFVRRVPGESKPAGSFEHPLYWIRPPLR